MHLQYRSIILVFSILLQTIFVDAARKCTEIMTDFTKGHEGWTELSGSKQGWSFTSQGLKMDLIPPKDPQPSKDKSEGGKCYLRNLALYTHHKQDYPITRILHLLLPAFNIRI